MGSGKSQRDWLGCSPASAPLRRQEASEILGPLLPLSLTHSLSRRAVCVPVTQRHRHTMERSLRWCPSSDLSVAAPAAGRITTRKQCRQFD